jgi:hypothetical protein
MRTYMAPFVCYPARIGTPGIMPPMGDLGGIGPIG